LPGLDASVGPTGRMSHCSGSLRRAQAFLRRETGGAPPGGLGLHADGDCEARRRRRVIPRSAASICGFARRADLGADETSISASTPTLEVAPTSVCASCARMARVVLEVRGRAEAFLDAPHVWFRLPAVAVMRSEISLGSEDPSCPPSLINFQVAPDNRPSATYSAPH